MTITKNMRGNVFTAADFVATLTKQHFVDPCLRYGRKHSMYYTLQTIYKCCFCVL